MKGSGKNNNQNRENEVVLRQISFCAKPMHKIFIIKYCIFLTLF